MSEPQYAFDPDHTPDPINNPDPDISHVVDEPHPIGEPPGELLIDSDGERVEIPRHLDGTPIGLTAPDLVE